MIARRSLLPLLLAVAAPALAQEAPKAPVHPDADFVMPGPVVALPPPVRAAVDGVRDTNLAAHIGFLASDGLEGRALGSSGLEAAAEYVAASLALAGIAPGAGTPAHPSYFQAVPFRRITRTSGQLTIESAGDAGRTARVFSAGADCLLPPLAPGDISGPVVLAAYGIREPALGRDDYRDLDVRGKIVIVQGGAPGGAAWQKGEMLARYGAEAGRARYARKMEAAAALGARAVLVVEELDSAAWKKEAASASSSYVLPDEESGALPPLVLVTPAVVRALLAGGDAATDAGAAGTPRVLAAARATIRIAGEERTQLARNVVAVVAGSDPKLKDQAVVVGAHLDHLGRNGDVVYPGADDNASGVAALIEMAKRLAASPVKPRRTVVFAFWTGEEEGHLGSDYYVRHPVWPLERTSLYANLDMIGHPWLADEIGKLMADAALPAADGLLARLKPADFVEPGVAEWAPELCPDLERAGRGLGLALHFDRTDGKNGGSDYRAFARRGVRFIRFFGNYFPGYHEAGDTAALLDVAQVGKMARFALATVWLVADR